MRRFMGILVPTVAGGLADNGCPVSCEVSAWQAFAPPQVVGPTWPSASPAGTRLRLSAEQGNIGDPGGNQTASSGIWKG
jgi:hypothetical protein